MNMLVIYLHNISIDSLYFGLPTAFSNRAENKPLFRVYSFHSKLNGKKREGIIQLYSENLGEIYLPIKK